MKDSYTRPPRTSRRDRQISRSQPARSTARQTNANDSKSFFQRLRMPTKFNIARGCIYGTLPLLRATRTTALTEVIAAVLVWTIICLAIAVHFQQILVSSDLSKSYTYLILTCFELCSQRVLFHSLFLYAVPACCL